MNGEAGESGALVESVYRDSHRLRVATGELSYRRLGAGRPVVLVHGIPLSLLTWRRVQPLLAERLDTLALDLPGFGRSSRELSDRSPGGLALALASVLDRLGLAEVDLVGSSFGCAPAVHLAVQEPERVRSLALINSVGAGGGRHSLERLVRIGALRALISRALSSRRTGRRLFEGRLRASFSQPRAASPAVVEAYWSLLSAPGGAEAFLGTLRQFDERALERLFSRLQVPTLILWGDADRVLPLGHAERLRRAIPGSRLEVLAGCGHLPQEERPEEVVQVLLKFWAGLGDAAREARPAELVG